ncbi:MAG: heme A synthase [Burkholderiales bacterium]|nr:MAG: heme A synthase [Burkholderiales bacterium]
MNAEVDLYNYAPVAKLLLLGILIALPVLLWVWMRHKNASITHRLRMLTLLTVFLTFDLTLFGAFTRLTDSGLGCPDWPGCYGMASPVGAKAQISAEQAVMPTGPVTHKKAWIEMIHRYFASGVGALILVLAAMTWRARRSLVVSPWWPTATLVWVCIQGAFGALTVTMKLFPAIVTMHLMGAMILLALLQVQAVKYEQSAKNFAATARTRTLLIAGFALLLWQIALGGWVSTNYAVLACAEFPMCQGAWIPKMDFRQGFEIWRELGQTGQGSTIALPALTAIHVVHRMFAFVVFGVLGYVAWLLFKQGQKDSAAWIAGLLLWQLITGLSNVVLGWPLIAAVSHTGGAAGLVLVCIAALMRMRVSETAQKPAQKDSHLKLVKSGAAS